MDRWCSRRYEEKGLAKDRRNDIIVTLQVEKEYDKNESISFS
jgi:hypothetical protein